MASFRSTWPWPPARWSRQTSDSPGRLNSPLDQMRVSGRIAPSSSPASATKGFIVEPGS